MTVALATDEKASRKFPELPDPGGFGIARVGRIGHKGRVLFVHLVSERTV
jgi:hypothetical protein